MAKCNGGPVIRFELGQVAGERIIQPDDPTFSGFVFKIQANMDPNHRDRIAFLRLTSGRFTRGMTVCDLRPAAQARANARVALHAQGEAALEWALQRLEHLLSR